jgi:multiple sugar transport system permease protein
MAASESVRLTAAPSKGRSLLRRLSVRQAMLALVALSLSLAFMLPIIWMLLASFRTVPDLTSYPPTLLPHAWTLANYTQVFKELPFLHLYRNTLLYAGTVTISSLLLDSMAAYALARLRFKGSSVVFVAIIILLMLPFQVTLVPLYVLMHNLGLVNTLPGLIIPRLSNAFGIFFMRQFFLGLPRDLEDAARIDGASEWRIFRQVIAPLAKPALLALGLFYFQGNWNDLIWPLIMTSNARDGTLPAGLSLFNGQHNINYGVVMAGSVLTLLPVILLFLVVQKSFVQGIATTGTK